MERALNDMRIPMPQGDFNCPSLTHGVGEAICLTVRGINFNSSIPATTPTQLRMACLHHSYKYHVEVDRKSVV